MEVAFWKSRKVFLTGHTGFKGSWLSLWLLSMGAEVCGYALAPPTSPGLFQSLAIENDMHSIVADIRDAAKLEQALRSFQPEIVLHMAAQPLVRASYDDPIGTYATNVMGTVHLLNAVRSTPSVRAVVSVTSDKCYENREWIWPYREDEAMGGHDPYSSSKGCAELVTAAFRNSYFPPGSFAEHRVAIASARAGNVIGGGDWAADRIVPDIVRAFNAGHAATVRNPDAVRPWQHVLEPLAGYLTLAEQLSKRGVEVSGGWNFGPAESDARPVRYLVAEMAKRWGQGTEGQKVAWQIAEDASVHEAKLLTLDSSKARTYLGWHPRWTIDEALEHTIAWYREFYAEGDMRQYSLQQLKAFTMSS